MNEKIFCEHCMEMTEQTFEGYTEYGRVYHCSVCGKDCVFEYTDDDLDEE